MAHRIRIDLEPEELPCTIKGWESFLAKLKEMLPGDPDNIELSALDTDMAHQFSSGDPVKGLILTFYADVPGAEGLDESISKMLDQERMVRRLDRDIRAIEQSFGVLPGLPPSETAAHLTKLKADRETAGPLLRDLTAEARRQGDLVRKAEQEYYRQVTLASGDF